MKRMIAMILMVATLLVTLIACGGSSFKCDLCQKESSGKKHNVDVLGQKLEYCDSCYKTMNGALDYLG